MCDGNVNVQMICQAQGKRSERSSITWNAIGKQMFLQPNNMINRYMGQTKYVQKFLKREGNITIGRKVRQWASQDSKTTCIYLNLGNNFVWKLIIYI